jgi:hypothetical protein
LEGHITFIFRVKDKAKQEPADVGSKLSLPSAWPFILPEDGQARVFFLFSIICLLLSSSEFVTSPPSFHLVIRPLV